MTKFEEIVEKIYKRSPLQKKKIEKYLSKKDINYFKAAEIFSNDYIRYLENQNIKLDYAIDSYLKMCSKMIKYQIEFMKTGKYSVDKSFDIIEKVYSNEEEMKSYMIGLAISQFIWETHYDMYNFFIKYLAKNYQKIKSYIEIGPGHGLFLKKALEYLKKEAKIVVVDISKISLDITKSIINYFMPMIKNIKYFNFDILEFDLKEKFDFINIGEVLEHVDKPEKLLSKLKYLLSPKGRIYISTCVNCPAIDHIYHFKTVDEIKEIFKLYGFNIEDELILPVEKLPWDEILSKKITINYCSILKIGV